MYLENFGAYIERWILKMIAENEAEERPGFESDFDNFNLITKIKISGLVDLLVQEFLIEPITVVKSLTYVKKFNSIFAVTFDNLYLVLYTSIIISVKIHSDLQIHIEDYRKIVAVKKDDLIALEKKILELLHYSCNVSEETLKETEKSLYA
jgi:hypothetical protein